MNCARNAGFIRLHAGGTAVLPGEFGVPQCKFTEKRHGILV